VHRDLKPGNVMITKAGAKLLDGATVQKPLTQEGTILGTFQYMAPEQLEAAEVDARTDIFALGALLYEMATGQRAFVAKSKASLIAAIVAKCLAKDPEERWQSARDVAQELRWIGEGASQVGVRAPVVATRRSRERFAWTAAAIASVLLIAAAFAAWRMSRRIEAPYAL